MPQTSSSALSSGKLLAGSVAAASLGVAAWAALRARRAERDHPPVGRFIDVDGVRLHYIDEGEGPVIVLLHGNLVMLQDYVASGLFDRLAQRHRVIAFDRPGFGFSERPRDRAWTPQAQAALFQQALKRMGLTRAVVVGQSLGCLAALSMALDPRIDIRGLALISGYFYPSARFDVLLTAPAAIPVIGDVMRYTVSPIAARLMINPNLRLMFAPQPVPDVFREMLPRELLLRPSQMRAIGEDAGYMVPAAHDLSRRYGEVSVPVRIFAGQDDTIVDADSQSGRLHGDIAQSTITVVPNRGHMLHYDEAGRIADAIEAMAIE
ncbi:MULTISPECIES: alpha/beta fold hydrolase [unclassified Caballeronia]|uniref:alpha/beta fold hydrolase n=1 Tax=unclassified Caballeronia TaxID=2646786 RepID=UPI002029A037|nr:MULTISPECIES: alpha/beta hydrolase [unclassified Caballeronia]